MKEMKNEEVMKIEEKYQCQYRNEENSESNESQ